VPARGLTLPTPARDPIDTVVVLETR